MKLKVIILLLLTVVLMSDNAFAQKDESTATLTETLSFLKNSIADWSDGHWGKYWSRHELVTSGGCKVQLVNTEERANGVIDYGRSEFSLSDLDPAGIELKAAGKDNQGIYTLVSIRLSTSNNKKLVRDIIGSGQSIVAEQTASAAGLWVHKDDESMTKSKRLKRAFEHAITLCGGKVDPF